MGESSQERPVAAVPLLTVQELSYLVAWGVFALFATLMAVGSAISLAWLRVQYWSWSRATSGIDGAVAGNPWDNASMFMILLAVSAGGAVLGVLGVSHMLWSARERRDVASGKPPRVSPRI